MSEWVPVDVPGACGCHVATYMSPRYGDHQLKHTSDASAIATATIAKKAAMALVITVRVAIMMSRQPLADGQSDEQQRTRLEVAVVAAKQSRMSDGR